VFQQESLDTPSCEEYLRVIQDRVRNGFWCWSRLRMSSYTACINKVPTVRNLRQSSRTVSSTFSSNYNMYSKKEHEMWRLCQTTSCQAQCPASWENHVLGFRPSTMLRCPNLVLRFACVYSSKLKQCDSCCRVC
jgi:hypothetical protein